MNVRLLLTLALIAAPLGSRAQDKPAVPAEATPAELTQRSWDLLTSTVTDTKHVDNCIQGIAALGTMGNDPRAAAMITTAMKDPELDIRVAAVLAAGQTKNPRLIPAMRAALDDAEPQVSFVAATTLWKAHDRSGQDLLIAVADGDRAANPKLAHGARHSASRTLHSPAALAKIGATQGAAFFLGPFGLGITAIEYARKNGGDSARANALDLLSEQHTEDVHQELLDNADDKDAIVRAAAVKGLGQWPGTATAKALEPRIDDAKLPVRLTAAAAYIRISTSGRPTGPRKH